MAKFIDLTGMRFGRLIVIRRGEDYITPKGVHKIRWWCLCDCQLDLPEEERKEVLIRGDALRDKSTQSCGCMHLEINADMCRNRRKYNRYDLSGDYGIGYTENLNNIGTNEFYFDLEDYDKIKDYWWYFNSGYVESKQSYGVIRLSRLVMNEENPNNIIDHIHGYKTTHDNRKNNLRVSTHQQNMLNTKIRSDNTSGATGVIWDESRNKWKVNIIYNSKSHYLGRYGSFEEAVKARKKAEDKYFGEWSYDNSQKM